MVDVTLGMRHHLTGASSIFSVDRAVNNVPPEHQWTDSTGGCRGISDVKREAAAW